jgi:hypothetical protein
MIPITTGETIFPRNKPNLNHIVFNGDNNFEFVKPNNKKITEINSKNKFNSFPLFNGHKDIIKKTTQKTIPKLRFVPIFIFESFIKLNIIYKFNL